MISRDNNFDLVRLLAAIQVLMGHSISHLQLGAESSILTFFPGVLMFFVISGFLITRSFDNLYKKNEKRKYTQYFKNRFLRIYPALWVVFLLTVFLLFIFGIISFKTIFEWDFFVWILGQISLFQFYTPDILRSFGVGTPNGSLWTIPVEIEFYFIIPAIYLIFRTRSVLLKYSIILFLSASFSFLFSVFLSSENIIGKLLSVSVFPYLYAFLLGGIIFLKWINIKVYVEGKFLYWLVLYTLFCYLFDAGPAYQLYTIKTFIANSLLGILTLSAAFTYPRLGRILKGNDLSYGMYIYHMLVINVLVQLDYIGRWSYLIVAVCVTLILAFLSWTFVEKKALMMKYK